MKLCNIYSLLLIVLLLFVSCDTKNKEVSMLESKGLYEENLGLKTLLFYNKDVGLIAGSSDEVTSNFNQNSDTFAFVNRTALLYKTLDGGKHWVSSKFGDGYLNQLIQVGEKTFAIKKSKDHSHTTVYFSVDMGESWIECKTFPEGVYNIFGIKNTLIAIATPDKILSHIYFSKDNGNNWERAVDPELRIGDCINLGTRLIYHSRSGDNNFIIDYDILSLKVTKVQIPPAFNYYFLTGYSNHVKLCGIQDNSIVVYSLQGGKLKYEYSTPEKHSMNFPIAFYNTKREDYIIVGCRQEGDVMHKILKTSDNGKSWETINFERDNLIEPFVFINDKGKIKGWFYAGSGKFQIFCP